MTQSHLSAKLALAWLIPIAMVALVAPVWAQHTVNEPMGDTGDAVTNRCPLVPMLLVIEYQGQSAPFLTLDERGDLHLSMSDVAPVAHHDHRGCIHGPDGVWVEWTLDEQLWTPRGITTVRGSSLVLPSRTLTIEPDGRITSTDPLDMDGDGVPDTTMRLLGYCPDGLCSALLLVESYLSMMPSMAVVDGHPIEVAPPALSACPELHEGGPTEGGATRDDNPFALSAQSGSVESLPPDLHSYLEEVRRAIEAHDWEALLELADHRHRRVQLGELGQAPEDYLLELIGLHWVGNDIEEPAPYPTTFPRLDRIRRAEARTWEIVMDGEWLEVSGILVLDSGETLRMRLVLIRVDGRYFLSGAVG